MAFETAKSANPFLMDDLDYGTAQASSNPFLSAEFTTSAGAADNPFLTASFNDEYQLAGTNPFASFGAAEYEPYDPPDNAATGNVFASLDTMEIRPNELDLIATNINHPENDFLVSSDDETVKPKRPPPPRPSMPKETQDLILSVTGALEATSHHLLDRLPPTRAPSPTAFPDFHSPSPTPELYSDLLGNEPPGLPAFPSQENLEVLAKPGPPPRPPPARPAPPPPRPAPPQPEEDLFDMFGTSKPPAPKSKDAILNLYSQPKPQPKDLLSDDIDIPLQAPILGQEVEQKTEEPLKEEAPTAMSISPQPDSPDEGPYIFGTGPPPRPERPPAPQAEPEVKPDDASYIFGTGPPQEAAEEEPTIFGVPKQSASPPNMFGADPEPEPTIFGVPKQTEPTIFGVPKQREPTIFGVPKQTEPTIFGVPDEPEPTIFGLPEQAEPTIFGVPPATEPTLFGVPSELEPVLREAEQPAFAAEPQGFGIEPTAFGADPVAFGTEPVGFGTEPAAFGMEPAGFGTEPAGFGTEPAAFGMESAGFGTEPAAFGMEPAGFGTEPTAFGTDPAAFGTEPTAFGTEPAIFGTTPAIFGTQPPDTGMYEEVPKAPSSGGVFGLDTSQPAHIFGTGPPPAAPVDAFDAFAAKFDQAEDHRGTQDPFDPFGGAGKPSAGGDIWGGSGAAETSESGFGGDDTFDAFLSMSQPPQAPPVPPQPPSRLKRAESGDSEEGGFNIFIKPREGDYMPQSANGGAMPVLAPPPKSPAGNSAYSDNGPRFNPFDKGGELAAFATEGLPLPGLSQTEPYEGGFKRSDSQETPPTPLFDDDVSQPLEEFPRIHLVSEGWEMQLRQPNKKKITGQRFWKKIFMKLVYQGDNPVLQLYNLKEDKDPFQELPLQACYSVSDISAQQYDQFGKIFTVKLQYIFYKERPGVRPGQVTKAERITNKLSQFAAYAIQGDYQGVKEFGSDLKKLGLPVEHAPQISQLLKIGCMAFEDLKQFSVTIEECLFKMPVHRDRALNYKMEEVQITVVDETYVEQDGFGHVEKQIARVRLFFLGFLSGMPDVELGMNDMWRQGKEVVGRHDIIPVVTEEWIRLEAVEFHSCIQQDEYERTRTIKFKPPDACYIELMRFRIRPPKNRELPLQLKAVMCITGNRVELRADVLVPGFTSRKLGQIPCEDVMIRFPIPECWIYLFRVEKHFRYGSVKSAHRRTGKIKGIERFLGAVDTLEPSLMEVTSGQAKYEHQHRAIVWRMPRLPKEGQGAYTTHNLVCRMQLTSYDQIPDNLADFAYVEFTMPATQASHTTVRSVSLVDSPSDNPPEKYVRQLARHEYRVGIEHTHTEETAAYVAATITKPKPPPEPVPEAPPPVAQDSDSDSSG